jgi:hypothetical protein
MMAQPLWIAAGVIGVIATFVWLDGLSETPSEQRREVPPSDETSPWGDIVHFPPGFHSADIVEGAQRDHE